MMVFTCVHLKLGIFHLQTGTNSLAQSQRDESVRLRNRLASSSGLGIDRSPKGLEKNEAGMYTTIHSDSLIHSAILIYFIIMFPYVPICCHYFSNPMQSSFISDQSIIQRNHRSKTHLLATQNLQRPGHFKEDGRGDADAAGPGDASRFATRPADGGDGGDGAASARST